MRTTHGNITQQKTAQLTERSSIYISTYCAHMPPYILTCQQRGGKCVLDASLLGGVDKGAKWPYGRHPPHDSVVYPPPGAAFGGVFRGLYVGVYICMYVYI